MSLKRPQTKTNVLVDSCYVSAEEAAAYLQITKQRLYNLTYLKIVPHYKFGKKLLFKKADLDALIVKIEARNNLWIQLAKKENTGLRSQLQSIQKNKSSLPSVQLLDRRRREFRSKNT